MKKLFSCRSSKIVLLSFLILTISAMMFLFSGCGDENDETYEFNLAHFFPGTHPAETELVQGWAAAILEATDGKVKIVSYPGETLAKAADIYNSVVEGSIDIGLSCFAYTPGRFPVLEAFELPGITYLNSSSASMVAWEGIKELDPEEVQDTKLLMVICTGPGDLFTKTPVRCLEDLQGMEIRATGLSADTIEILGGIPVGMPQSEVYDALLKGIVKGNLSPIETLKCWKHAEITKYITKTPFLYNTLFFVTMNLEKWESLPKDLQDKIIKTTEKFHEEVAIGLWDRQNEAALTYAVDEQGMEIIELSEEEKELWISKVLPLQDTYRSKLAEAGIDADPLELIDQLAEKYNKKYE